MVGGASASYGTSRGRDHGYSAGVVFLGFYLLNVHRLPLLVRREHGCVSQSQICVDDCAINSLLYSDLRRGAGRADLKSGHHHNDPVRTQFEARLGPPLHLNRHETPPICEVSQSTAAGGRNPDFASWMEVARGKRPAMSDEQLGEIYAYQQALKQRVLFRPDGRKKPVFTRNAACRCAPGFSPVCWTPVGHAMQRRDDGA